MRSVICTIVIFFSAQALADSLMIRNVHLVDIENDRIKGLVSVMIRDDFIAGVFEHDPVPEAGQVVDGNQGYLIPGLAEMHAHVPPADPRQRAEDVLMLYLAHGITTIRGMLGEPGHLEIKRDLAEGTLPGPRLITSGPSFNGTSVTSPAQAAAMVRAQQEAGYDFLKLHPGLWPEAFDVITHTANALGIAFAGHVSAAVSLGRALEAGYATIDHLDGYAEALVPEDHELSGTEPEFFGINLAGALDPERIPSLAQRTAAAGVWNVPTQALFEHLFGQTPVDELMARPAMRYIDPATRARWEQSARGARERMDEDMRERFIGVRMQLIKALFDAGAGLLLGADAPQIMNVPGQSAHEELVLYVQAGLTPAQALATGTVNVARFFGQSAQGCLNEGCVADVVLLTANPLEDIANTQKIAGVARAGAWYDRQTLDSALDAIAERANGSDD